MRSMLLQKVMTDQKRSVSKADFSRSFQVVAEPRRAAIVLG